MTLGQTFAARVEYQRNMGIGRGQETEQFGEEQLSRCRVEKIIAPHHLTNALGMIIDHNSKVVGGHTIGATNHEIVDLALELADHGIDEPVSPTFTPDPQRGSTTSSLALSTLAGTEIATGTHIGERRGMGGASSRFSIGEDLLTGAEAGVGLTSRNQRCEGEVMVLASLGLPHDHTIVVESERCKIGKSSLGVFGAR